MADDWKRCEAPLHEGDERDDTVAWRDVGLLCDTCDAAFTDRRPLDAEIERLKRAGAEAVGRGAESRREVEEKLARLRADMAQWRDRIERVEAENERLRELYDNARSFKARGWSIDHLMECEEALRTVQETAERQYVALKFYADLENYDPHTAAIRESAVGLTARAALGVPNA